MCYSAGPSQQPTYPPIGTVSSGTMRDEGLIPEFLSVLQRYNPERAAVIENRPENAALFRWLEQDYEPDDDTEYEYDRQVWMDHSSELTNDLFDELDAIAPPYCHFGASEGDGAEYGFWPDLESLDDDTTQGYVVKVDTTPDYIAHVSDHGNVTLYSVELREVWSVV